MRILLPVVVVAVLLAALFLDQRRDEPFVVSGFVEADEIRVGSRVGGRVALVRVEEGDAVEPGDVLLVLEPFDLAEERAGAAARLAARRAEHEELTSGLRPEEILQARARRDELAARLDELRAGPRPPEIAAARSRVTLAEARLELARQEYWRAEKLAATQAASQETLDRATSELAVAEASLDVAEQELALLQEGTRPETIAQARAELASAEAALALAEAGYRTERIAQAAALAASAEAELAAIDRRLAELTVRAPVSGTVEAVDLEPGDLLGPDAPALSLLDGSTLWVRAYVPENRIGVAVGDVVEVRVDAWPDERFPGRVGFVARHAEFTPGNVQTPEERSKQVFRIKVLLEEGLDRLRPGMAADVHLEER